MQAFAKQVGSELNVDVQEKFREVFILSQEVDSLFVFSCLVVCFQDASGRVKALEGKLATLIEERDSAKQNVRDAIHAVKAAVDDVRQKAKGTTLTLLAEDSSRHTGLSEVRNAVCHHA